MNCTLIGANPAQLAVAGDMVPEAAHILGNPVQLKPRHQGTECFDGGNTDFVAATDRKGQTVPLVLAVCFQNDISRGVVRIRIHSIRAV